MALEHVDDERVEPTLELYEQYVAFWTDAHSSNVSEGIQCPAMEIDGSFEIFSQKWNSLSSHSQREWADCYQQGWQKNYEQSMQNTLEAIRKYQEDPDERKRVNAEIGALLKDIGLPPQFRPRHQ